jgi:pimeloyl-ACP methyl ester carboxylesterase
LSELQHETGFLDVPGGQLYYTVTGSGHPLVLIHAGVADHHMWDAQVPAFAERYRVIRYDLRGSGQTRTEAVSFSNRADLAALLGHLGVTQAHVVGLSRGGQIAVDFTLDHPAIVTALVAVAAGLSGYRHEPTEADAATLAMFAEIDAAEAAGDFARLNDLEVRLWVDGPGQPPTRVPAAIREQVRQMNGAYYNNAAGGAEPQPVPLDPPAAERLAEIRVPALVIVGDLDTPAAQRSADLLAAGIPSARKEVFAGVAHMVNMEQPERFTALVLEFLENV